MHLKFSVYKNKQGLTLTWNLDCLIPDLSGTGLVWGTCQYLQSSVSA